MSHAAFKSFLLDQLLLQRQSYGLDPRSLKGEERVEFLRWNILAAIRELTEMLDKVDGWKPWQTERATAGEWKVDSEQFVLEGVDVLHFIANLLLLANCTDTELSELWEWKQNENRRRQEEGYAGVGNDVERRSQ